MATPPFTIQTVLPAATDLASQFPSVEHTFRDVVNSWFNILSDASTGKLKNSAFPDDLELAGLITFDETPKVGDDFMDHFPSGTSMLFPQAAAPTGWTKATTHDNKALRVVSGTPGSGGTIGFTTAFGSQNVGATALTTAQLPSHSHTYSGTTGSENATHTHSVYVSGYTSTDGNHYHDMSSKEGGYAYGGSITISRAYSNFTGSAGNTTGYAGSHYHSFSAYATVGTESAYHQHTYSGTTATAGSGSTHTHTLDLSVAYVDVMIATKD